MKKTDPTFQHTLKRMLNTPLKENKTLSEQNEESTHKAKS
jgi:hypothetical protein